MDKLSADERAVLESRYALGLSLDDVARRRGVSRLAIRRLESGALVKLGASGLVAWLLQVGHSTSAARASA